MKQLLQKMSSAEIVLPQVGQDVVGMLIILLILLSITLFAFSIDGMASFCKGVNKGC